ncbi:hypothetical protein B0T26DRAFT_748796 [Lasiosphaeria miniovina]|uniref:Uncharacterized protein n=1 Tax=Lasiosphaeria miniovina TaxID=1954250 RepID=A0AA40B6K4_9PEZI|nr:uncharacterized protein B0T26DRAFT_748796 [Lasiosphaeria miniovina]KAK0728608.1 hypothetical protein B0T26DRAFT_748796 [Lasiosphaeria miniovina]
MDKGKGKGNEEPKTSGAQEALLKKKLGTKVPVDAKLVGQERVRSKPCREAPPSAQKAQPRRVRFDEDEEDALNFLEYKAYLATSALGRSLDQSQEPAAAAGESASGARDPPTELSELDKLIEELQALTAEASGTAADDTTTPGQQAEKETTPQKEAEEKRDPEEVKAFWASVRAQLYISDDEIYGSDDEDDDEDDGDDAKAKKGKGEDEDEDEGKPSKLSPRARN